MVYKSEGLIAVDRSNKYFGANVRRYAYSFIF